VLPAVAFGLVAAASLVAVVLFLRLRGSRSLEPFPPLATGPATATTWEDFVGADACADCHTAEFAAWSRSTHGRAGGPPSRDVLLRAFDGRPIRFADAAVIPATGPDGRRSFTVRWNGRPEQRFEIEGVVGGGHMVGGGTQGYLTRYDDGTLRFLPFERVRREDTWFCNTNTRLDRGWLPITATMRLADCGDWPPIRVFGNLPRFANCQECHGSQIEVAPEPQRPANTRLKSLSIDCEACHGPGREHIAAIRSGGSGADIGMQPLATLSKDASVALCLRCHALKDGLDRGWLAGRDFDAYYSVKLPLVSATDVFADGRIRTFAYQQGHLWSDCFVSGSMTCVDCHDPHAQDYRDANYLPLPSRFDDGQCTSCHPSKAADPPQHTHHAVGSTGSRCVSCHMPYLQEPEVGEALRYARSDHTIPVPRPAADAALGIENACQTCHDDDAAMLDRQARDWWGTFKPRPAAVDALLRFQAGERDALDQALDADSTDTHAPARTIALGLLLTTRLRPDMPDLDDATTFRLRTAASSDDPDIAALGLAGLHLARGGQPATRRFLVQRISTLGAMEKAVRSRWTVALGAVADDLRLNEKTADAIAVYDKALEIEPDNADVLLNRGLARAAAGDAPSAEADYLRSVALDSLNTLAWVNLGIVRAAYGDAGGAITAYRSASRIDPRDPLPWFNLGNLFLRANRYDDAIDAYRRAVEFAPGLADARFNLARALIFTNRLEDAQAALRDGLEFEPDNAAARQALTQIDSVLRTQNARH
jgi:tetratricopeptide (TPR) repeat protein